MALKEDQGEAAEPSPKRRKNARSEEAEAAAAASEALVAQRKAAGEKSSQYTGVSWDKAKRKWAAETEINGRKKKLGRFETEEGAAEAYRVALEEGKKN